MGLASSTFRLMYLNSFRLDLENKIQLVTESKLSLTKTISEMTNVGNDMDPESEIVKQLNQRKERLNALDKKLDMQMEMYNTQLKMIDSEMESCKALRDKNIQRSFSYGN
ncbi:MAG: hypothetical protein PHV37_06195 [Candidatus Gastranaerophilales bacterium]|nr:hypothetical protein [Candidatus Gastranaerophilales bacterium]